MEKRLEDLLEAKSLEDILEECDLTEFDVLEILFNQGYIITENEPL